MEIRSVTLGGFATSYRVAGEGPPVLMVHGGDPGVGPGSLLWSRNIDPIARAGYRVFAVDRLGYGRSAGLLDPADHDVDRFVDHLELFIDQCIQAPVHGLVSQSRGTLLAMLLMMRRPDQFQRLVIANTNSVAPAYGATHGTRSAADADPAETLKTLINRPDRLSADWFAEVSELGLLEQIRQTRQIHQQARSGYLARLGERKLEVIEWLGSRSSHPPTLLVWGANDRMTTQADAAQVFELFDRPTTPVSMITVNRCGHFPFLEYSDLFNESVRKHLAADG